MPKKKKHHHRKTKRKSHLFAHHTFEDESTGHHARLRKHHAQSGHHASGGHRTKAKKKSSKQGAKPRKTSALLARLRKAEAGAREQIRNFRGRRGKHHQSADKPVTEETLRNHMALKCVRRCSH
jgi:hypothetical protein